MSPYRLTDIPLTLDSFINSNSVSKITVSGSKLEEHIGLFKLINQDVLIPTKSKSAYSNIRLYYELISTMKGKLLDVAMWGVNDYSVFVNGVEVENSNVFYDVIIPFLPKDDAKEWENFKTTKGNFN